MDHLKKNVCPQWSTAHHGASLSLTAIPGGSSVGEDTRRRDGEVRRLALSTCMPGTSYPGLTDLTYLQAVCLSQKILRGL